MTPEERELAQRMLDDAITNGDHQGAADLTQMLADDPRSDVEEPPC
jgi:hypothetical protein